MKKLFACLFIAFALHAAAQDKGKDEGLKADIKFEATTHDFGKFREGTQAMHEFVFVNTGQVPLVLSNVQPSCGCTTPEWSRAPIAPGSKGKIKAVFNSYARPGTFQKYITVKSNAASGDVELIIKGVVEVAPPDPVSPVRLHSNE